MTCVLKSHRVIRALLFALILTALSCTSIVSAESPGKNLASIWRNVRRAETYGFTTDVVQTTTPQSTVRNVGRTGKTQRLHLEGKTDLPNQQLQMTLWSKGGSVLDATSGIEIKVEGDRAYARHGAQGWKEINNFAGLFAPHGDFMAFLAAAKDVQETGTGDSRVARTYAFRIDGRSYARYLRDQMETTLAERSELPIGVTLDLPKSYVDMTGDGELWVGEDGLPLRQILHLHFPPRPDEQEIAADVTVDFDFGDAALGQQPASPLPVLLRLSPETMSRVPQYTLDLTLSLAFCVVLIAYRGSRKLYAALALVLIASMIVTPLLQSLYAADFNERQAARTREAEAREQESSLQQTINTLTTESDHQPNANPLTAGNDEDTSDADANDDCDPDAPGDTDDDGLTDGEECVLGTSDDNDDSDNDGLTDGEEVAGFDYNGTTWYTDPLAPDTNDDGIGDLVEWNTGRDDGDPPPDLDGDGTPNLFDLDNDDDGVPDSLDLSPFYRGDTTFTNDAPFELIVDDLNEGQPTFVEFQLRPTNPDHLWYAFNVLDWPEGDNQGQIQDDDGATFYDVDDSTSRSPNDNGDLKMVPMLEIRITGSPDNLPPEEDLKPYGIFVQDLDNNGDNKVAYIPLQLVVENRGDERVAFAGKMRYLPGEEWGNAHQVRLVWAIKALVDVCSRTEDGRCVVYEEMNVTQVIQTYPDDWTLTGLNVREDHGTDYDVIFEDPAVDSDLEDDSTLLFLTYGLERTFVAGSDCEDIDDKGTDDPDDDTCIAGDGERDITVEEIHRRWNHATSTVSETLRWSLENILTVYTRTYTTLDEAIATMAMTETKAILDDHFTAHAPVTPTLLLAREERSRTLNLDAGVNGDDNITWSGDNPRRLTVTLDRDDVPIETTAGLNWGPYRYEDGEWVACPIEDYWDELHRRYSDDFAAEYTGEDDPDEVRGGAVIVGQLHYLTLYLGVSNVVESGDELLTQKDIQTYDRPLWSSITKTGAVAILFIVNKVIMRNFWNSTQLLRGLFSIMSQHKFVNAHKIGGTALRAAKVVKQWTSASKWRLGAIGFAVVIVLALVITAIVFLAKGFFNDNPAAKKATAAIVGIVLFAGAVLLPIFQVTNLILGARALYNISTFAATVRVLKAPSKFIGLARGVLVALMVVTILVSWGVFIYAVVKEDVPPSSVAFDMLLAQTIASTILAILTFALSITIVGAIIVAIVAVIDVILTILGKDWTISGWMTDVITKAIFSYELAIDVDADDLVVMGQMDSNLVDPELGMTGGNRLEFTIPVTTTITHEDPSDWRTKFYLWMYSKDQLKSTTFKYTLTPEEASLSARLGQSKDNWHVSERAEDYGWHTMYTAWKQDDVSTVTTLQTGINRALDLTVNSAYAIPGVECWTLVIVIPWPPVYLPIPVCYRKGVDGSLSTNLGEAIVFDVLPPTLDEFVDVATWASGMTFRDADGDGLLAQSHNGNDPDDTTWDTDGDGLSDAWELERSSVAANEGGQFYNPRDADTDDDGLDDGEEARLGTNPNNADSDGDGLTDYAEAVDGWTFTYAEGKSIRVYSDPLGDDPDGDGMSDLFERTLHTCPGCDPLKNRYHPHVWNTSPVGLTTDVEDPNDVVSPGQTFVVTTTVQNNLNPDLWVRGTTDLAAGPLTGGPMGMTFDIPRNQSQALIANLTVPVGVGNQDVDLDTTMLGELHTPSVWAWDAQDNGSQSASTGAVPRGIAVTPVSKWTTPYVAVALEDDEIHAYALTAEGYTGDSAFVMGGSGHESNATPDLACNDDGLCLVVWSSTDTTVPEDYFRLRRLSPTLNVEGDVTTITAPSGMETFGGAVASDGDGFLVVWAEGSTVSRTLKAAHVNEYGTVSSPTLTLDAGALGEAHVAHAFDRYQVVWERDDDLFAAEIAGFDVSPITVTDTPTDVEAQPRIAYDPLSHRSLIVYSLQTGGKQHLYSRVLVGGKVQDRVRISGTGSNLNPVQLAVSADPVNGGWIVTWKETGWRYIYTMGFGFNGERRGRSGSIRLSSNDSSVLDVACVAPRPSMELLFDEDSGATDFADNSGFGNDAACTDDGDYDCPLSGVGGKDGNAVQFDGDKDVVFAPLDPSEKEYAVTLWFKATCQTCGLFEVSNDAVPGQSSYQADRILSLSNGNVCAKLGRSNAETICSSGTNYADGTWHQIAHTFGETLDGQRLYVDGDLAVSGSRATSDFAAGNRLRIGYGGGRDGTYFTGVVDAVTLYPRTLSGGEVRDAYRAALAIFPFDEVDGATIFENAAHNGYTGDCSSGECPTAGLGGRAYASVEFDGDNNVIQTLNNDQTVAEYVYDFEGSVPGEWSQTNRATTPGGGRGFLGRFGGESVALNLTNLPAHDRVEVEFDLFVIGNWNGTSTVGGYGPDYWQWSADGNRQLRTTFTNFNPPNAYQFYPGEPWTPSGVTVHGHVPGSGAPRTWFFRRDDRDIEPYIIDMDSFDIGSDTVVRTYWNSNYGGYETTCDGKQLAENGTGCGNAGGNAGSIRVWAAANPGGTGALERDTLGYNRDTVYRIRGDFDHVAATLALDFEGLLQESIDNESWGLDNVRVRVINGNVPLANNSFTVAFWSKRDTTDTADYAVGQGEAFPNEGLHIGYRGNGYFTCAFYDDDLETTSQYYYRDWRHWACTYDADTNTRTLYLNGDQVAQDTAGADYAGSGPLYIGRALWDNASAFDGRLDEVAIWRDALTADEIETLYNKVKALDDSVTECIVPRLNLTDTELYAHRLALRETTTFLGTVEQQQKDTLTIDATLPESTITSLAEGQILNITGTLVIGGEARDNTFVTQVDVRIDGGPWQTADGAETWTYAWDTAAYGDGPHTIESRATDAGDSAQAPPDSITVVIDRTPPELAADAPPRKAIKDVAGDWTVALTGVITDAHPASVDALLVGQDGAAGSGWQPATLAGNAWSIAYTLSDFDNDQNALSVPTGVYTLSLRAADVPGNQSPEAVYLPPVHLDNTPPDVSLTFPLSDTAALTDTTVFITGVVTDVGGVTNGVGRVETAFKDVETSSALEWHDAVLAQPGNITSTWAYTLPAPVEGFYEIYLRGTDVLDNRNEQQSTWIAWQGMIDTEAPRVDANVLYNVMGDVTWGATSVITYSDVTCQAIDLTLDGDRFTGCPCDESTWRFTTYDDVSPWYRDTFSDTTLLHQIDAHCLLMGEFVAPPTVHAYDAAGQHSQTVISETIEPLLLIDSAVFTPTDGTLVTTTTPFNVEGYAAAIFGISNITVTVNGDIWQTHFYGGGITQDWIDLFSPATYNPPGDGRYRFVSIARENNRPSGNREQTVLHPVTITVDSLPPSIPTFDSTIISTSHRTSSGTLLLTGIVTDIVEVRDVHVDRDQPDEGWFRAAHDGVQWSFPWPSVEEDADPNVYTVTVKASDIADHVSQITQTVTFDMVPPELVTPTLYYVQPGLPPQAFPLEPGETIRDHNYLKAAWTPSADGNGVLGYQAGWTTSPTDTTGIAFQPHTAASTYSVTQLIGEAQTVYAHVVSLDIAGNRQPQVAGPIYVDAPTTPDIIAFPSHDGGGGIYHGWMDSGCSLMGIDRRVETHAFDGAALNEPQKFYATWNQDALRLAWQGANWDYQGDLFVYFDTAAGGATTLYNPTAGGTTTDTVIYLPGNAPVVDTSTWPEFEAIRQTRLITPLLSEAMQADYLLWIKDAMSATLLVWDGAAWITDTFLLSDTYRLNGKLTDIDLPFDALGITHPATSTMNLLAVATEEPTDGSLRLWATMPDRNLVNSPLAVNPTSAAAGGSSSDFFVLTRAYRWHSLGSGLCPNDPFQSITGLLFPDTELTAGIHVTPTGSTFALSADDLYHEWAAFFQDEGPEQRQFDFLDHNHPPVGQGSTITYTVEVTNRGEVTATDIQAFVTAYYALHLPNATRDEAGYREYQTVDVGDIEPNGTATATITGTIDVDTNWRYDRCINVAGLPEAECRPLLAWATLESLVFDSRTPLTLTGILIPEAPPLEWLWADHPMDIDPPEYVGIDPGPIVIGPSSLTEFAADLTGYAVDASGVPLVEIQVRDPLSATSILSCPDATPHDGRWACVWTVSGSDGDAYDLRARATDSFDQTGEWTSPWRTIVLDSTPPTVTLDVEAQTAVDGQLVGPEGFRLTGIFTDSHSQGAVDVCDTANNETDCTAATLILSTQAPAGTTSVYDDAPGAPVDLGTAICGGGEITRTFAVSESFVVGDVDLGFAAAHPHREELVVDLVSPAGTHAHVIGGWGNDANQYANYDVWLDDAATGVLHNNADDDPAAPAFERHAAPDAALSAFNGEVSAGMWTLRMCDLLPGLNDGAYHAARLSLTPQSAALSSAGTWSYALRTPDGHDGVTHTLAIHALDEVGNRTPEPISLTYRLDTVAPVLTVTAALDRSAILGPSPVLTGQVSDGGGMEGVYVRVDPPDGASYRDNTDGDGTNWSFTLRAGDVGTHTLWLEAYDEAGNTTKAGPYAVEVYDNAPPEIVARAPYPGAGNVPLTATVTITFSEAISRATFAYSVSPDPGGWNETWDMLSEVVTLTHAAFAYGTRVTVTVSAAGDLAGNPLDGAPVAWWFETVPEPDTTSPEIVAVSPPDGALDVPLTAPVVITFSESISTSTFAHTASPDPGGWSTAWDAARLVVTLTHAPLADATWTTVTVTAADDVAGNPLDGAPVVWKFATPGAADIIPPEIIAVEPVSGTPGVALAAAVVITFSEAIDVPTLSYTVVPDPGGWSETWIASSEWVTLTHDVFTETTRYTVTVSAADDLAGNPLADAPVAWWFETAAADVVKVYLPLVMRDE